MTGVEAKAIIAPSATVVEAILERCDSFSIDDMCRQPIPLCEYSVAERVLSNFQLTLISHSYFFNYDCSYVL